MVVTVSHAGYISASRSRPIAPARGARAAPACRRVRRISSSAVRRLDPCAGAVLLLARQVYKEKGVALPLAAPQARGKALVNIAPAGAGRAHHLDHGAAETNALGGAGLMFATTRGTVRRNKCRIRAGQSRRKNRDELDPGEGIVDVQDLPGGSGRPADHRQRPVTRSP